MAQLRSFPKGTASGPSGLSAQHLLDAIFPGEVTVINALTSVVQLLVAGLVPPDVMPFIAGANLTALTKKNEDIRPIAVGDTLRCLTAKCLCSLVREAAASYFLPLQLGVAVPGGAESIIHGLRATWENNDGLDIALLKVDFCNAFNCVSCQVLLDECLSVFPGIYKWAKWFIISSILQQLGHFIIIRSSARRPTGSTSFLPCATQASDENRKT